MSNRFKPAKYLDENVRLPDHLPRDISAEEAHAWLRLHGEAEYKGFCPVTYREGDFQYDSLKRYDYLIEIRAIVIHILRARV